LYGWTVLGKFHYDLSLDVTALDRGGGRRWCKQNPGLVILGKNAREIISTTGQRGEVCSMHAPWHRALYCNVFLNWFTLFAIASLIIVYLCYVVIDILLTNLGLLTLFALWLDTANLRGKIKIGVSTVIIAIVRETWISANYIVTKQFLHQYVCKGV